jgi:dihydroorotate dehydrogenase electron transfer subunit
LYHITTTVLNQHPINPNFYKLTFKSAEIARKIIPGQFITIDCGTFLRRPFTVAHKEQDKIEIIYKVIGPGTNQLSTKKFGDTIDVLGPLGTGYDITVRLIRNSDIVLVGGGTGIASLIFLAETISKLKMRGTILYGTKTKTELVNLANLKKAGWSVQIATETGDTPGGYKGYVTDLFKKHVDKHGCTGRVYTSGPVLMLKKMVEICNNIRISGQASLEQIIACGMGTCRGCVIETSTGNKSICKDGPVFNMKDLII